MELWYTEYQTENLGFTVRIKETLYTGRSQFQEIAVVDSYEFGRMLVLDGVFQTSIVDEYIYHEMIAHVPLGVHPNPQTVLVIGGGDGGTIREVVKHRSKWRRWLRLMARWLMFVNSICRKSVWRSMKTIRSCVLRLVTALSTCRKWKTNTMLSLLIVLILLVPVKDCSPMPSTRMYIRP
jgi:predicted membrane-bound spermidine synthase